MPLELRLKPLINAAEMSRDFTTLHELFDQIFEVMADEEYPPDIDLEKKPMVEICLFPRLFFSPTATNPYII